MKPIYEMKLIQIEVTNACTHQCANCTRFVGHHKKPYFMDLETVEKALITLQDYPGHIGMMGGEPTLHPQFREICKLYQKYIPAKTRRELWTAGHKWEEYKDIIQETFYDEAIAYNDHTQADGKHHPLLVAADDAIDDKELMWNLIDDCWVQKRWSASVTPKGCFFCEVAAAMDHMLDGPGGYPLEEGWWRRTPVDFADQVKRYCPKCSGSIPMEKVSDHEKYDLISKTNLERLKEIGSPKCLKGNVKLFDKKFTLKDIQNLKKDWKPQNYRTFVAHKPEDYKNVKKL